jgi:hypothetical protein
MNTITPSQKNRITSTTESLPDHPVLRKLRGIRAGCGILLLTVISAALCNAAEPLRAYQCGFKIALKLGGDLSESLPAKFGNQIDSQAIALQPQETPVVAPIVTTEENGVQRQVTLSAGFIDLLNHICHAKAVDRIQPGFFNQYIKNLAEGSYDGTVRPPKIVDPRYWTDDVINDQMSYFNQMIGFIKAINLSHHYLGHYAKYCSRMIGPGDKLTPINDFLTPAEWEVSVKAAAVDSLNCALATDGPRALFEAIDKMPVRPAWADYIMPPNVNVKKLNKQLVCYETSFFRGELK